MEVPKVRRGFLFLETGRWHILPDELGVCKPDCWSPSGSVCSWALGLCECPSQSEVEVPHLWPLLHPRADSIPGSKSTFKGHKLAFVRLGPCGLWWSQLWFCWETRHGSPLWLEGWRFAWTWRCLCQRGGSDELSALHSRTGRRPLCIFLSPFSPAYQIVYLLLTMPVFNYFLHDLAWNKVLVTDPPGLVWSLSTVQCHPSAFNMASWPMWVRLPFSRFCIPLGLRNCDVTNQSQDRMEWLNLCFASFLKLSSCLLINSQNAAKVLSSWFQLWGIYDF